MTDEIILGLVIDIKTAKLLVRKGQLCPEHKKPIHVVTTFDGRDPDSKCIDCLVDMFTGMIDLAIESTAAAHAKIG